MADHAKTSYDICKGNNSEAVKVGRWTAEQFYIAISNFNAEQREKARQLKALKGKK